MAIVYSMFIGFNGPLPWRSNKATLFHYLNESGLNGFTVTEATGFYNGSEEPSAVVTVIVNEEEDYAKIEKILRNIARHYKLACQQDEVWITRRREDLYVI